jgi:NADP-dependent 3-hydroxy acid dehydrogenase YdfG
MAPLVALCVLEAASGNVPRGSFWRVAGTGAFGFALVQKPHSKQIRPCAVTPHIPLVPISSSLSSTNSMSVTTANSNNISGKVVVITGASSGIGEAIARYLAQLGAKVVLGARRVNNLEKIVKEITAGGGQATLFAVDITNSQQVDAFAKFAVDTYGRIDVLINNAGVMLLSPIAARRVEEWDTMIDVNVKGLLYGVAAAIPSFQTQKSGHVINISSTAGLNVFPPGSVYSATKFAVNAISEGLRQELIPLNVRVTNICPGAIESELKNHTTHEETIQLVSQFILQSLPALEIAKAVAYAIEQPDYTSINQITIRPSTQLQ